MAARPARPGARPTPKAVVVPTSEQRDSKAADAAVAEVDAELLDSDLTKVEFKGKTYAYKQGAVRSPQFRRLWQRGQDVMAMEMLLGVDQFDQWLSATEGPDGFTPREDWRDFMEAIGESIGSGNS